MPVVMTIGTGWYAAALYGDLAGDGEVDMMARARMQHHMRHLAQHRRALVVVAERAPVLAEGREAEPLLGARILRPDHDHQRGAAPYRRRSRWRPPLAVR